MSGPSVRWFDIDGGRAAFVRVEGHLPRKDNQRFIAKRPDGKLFIPKGKPAQQYEKVFMYANCARAQPPLGSAEMLLQLSGTIWYRDKFRGDLAYELVLDCLAKSEIIADDRWVVSHRVSKAWDHENPRIELWVCEIPAEQYDWSTGKMLEGYKWPNPEFPK
jgi:hypothetical protein